jgi:hypothetical protein
MVLVSSARPGAEPVRTTVPVSIPDWTSNGTLIWPAGIKTLVGAAMRDVLGVRSMVCPIRPAGASNEAVKVRVSRVAISATLGVKMTAVGTAKAETVTNEGDESSSPSLTMSRAT